MDATVLDLRYRMADVLKALDRREEVRVLYHGKVTAHPYFGSRPDQESVDISMDRLRGGRFRDL
jgi:hypothetical protein